MPSCDNSLLHSTYCLCFMPSELQHSPLPFQHCLTVLFPAAENCYSLRCYEVLLNPTAVKQELS